jgi:hypothetical protein
MPIVETIANGVALFNMIETASASLKDNSVQLIRAVILMLGDRIRYHRLHSPRQNQILPQNFLGKEEGRKRTMKYLSLSMLALFLSAGTVSAASEVPKAAIEACLKHANTATDAAPGTATYSGNATDGVAWFGGPGDHFKLIINVKGYQDMSCIVSPDGKHVAIQPSES